MEPNLPTGETMSDGNGASTTNEGQETPTGDPTSSGLSPDFVKMAQALVQGASPEQLSYIQQCCDDEEKQQSASGASEAGGTPETYSAEDMPQS